MAERSQTRSGRKFPAILREIGRELLDARDDWCGAASNLSGRFATLFYDSVSLILWGESMSSTIIILLAAWLGLNAAFVAIRFYITADQTSRAEHDLGRYPRLVS